MAKSPPAFDPTDPVDRAAEAARRHVTTAMIAIAESGEIAALPPGTALSATIAGALTGVVGSLLAQVRPDSRDELMKVIEDWLPQAREQAESILISGQRR